MQTNGIRSLMVGTAGAVVLAFGTSPASAASVGKSDPLWNAINQQTSQAITARNPGSSTSDSSGYFGNETGSTLDAPEGKGTGGGLLTSPANRSGSFATGLSGRRATSAERMPANMVPVVRSARKAAQAAAAAEARATTARSPKIATKAESRAEAAAKAAEQAAAKARKMAAKIGSTSAQTAALSAAEAAFLARADAAEAANAPGAAPARGSANGG